MKEKTIKDVMREHIVRLGSKVNPPLTEAEADKVIMESECLASQYVLSERFADTPMNSMNGVLILTTLFLGGYSLGTGRINRNADGVNINSINQPTSTN